MRVEVIATSLIAVFGTLLGSVATYWIQRSTVRQQEGLARAERLRQERVEAFTEYGGALHNYRRARMDRWHVANGETALDPDALRREVFELRAVVIERGYRVRLLVTAPDLVELGEQAMKSVDVIGPKASREDYDVARKVSKAAIERFVDASRDYLAEIRRANEA